MSNTPVTDKAEFESVDSDWRKMMVVKSSLSRTLERESAANKEELRRTQEEFRRSEARLAAKTAQAEALANEIESLLSVFANFTQIPAAVIGQNIEAAGAALRQYRGET